MRIRHKVPSIFSLSMVDVLCCALGCVILIWLLNAKQSEDEADERREELTALRLRAEADQAESGKLLAASRAEYALAGTRLAQLLDERRKAAANVLALEGRISDLESVRTSLEKGRDVARADADDLKGKMKLSSARVAAFTIDLKTATSRADDLEGTLGKTSARLKDEEAAVRAARANLAAMGKVRDAERARSDELAKSLAQRERDLEATTKSLTASNRTRTAMETTLARKDAEIKDLRRVEDR